MFTWLLHAHQVSRYIWSKYWWSWQVFESKQQHWIYGEDIEVETSSTNSTKHPWSKLFALLHLEVLMIVVSIPKVSYLSSLFFWFYKFMLLDCKSSWWHKIYDPGKGRAKKMTIFDPWRVCNSIWLHIFFPAELAYSSITFAGCYPFTDRDPFYVETCPHVYFVGNQDKYESRLIKGMFWIF